MRSSLILAAALLVAGCGSPITITPPPLHCGRLVEAAGLLAPTEPAPPPGDDTIGAWVTFGDAQTGALDKANADKAGAAKLLSACEAYTDAIAPPRRKFMGVF